MSEDVATREGAEKHDQTDDGATPKVEPFKMNGRISCVTRVYYTSPSFPPMTVCDQWYRWGQTDQAAYQRPNCVAGDTWEPIDLGWLRDNSVGLIVFSNDEGRVSEAVNTHPTTAEREETERRVLEVCFSDRRTADVFVLPGTSLPLTPVLPQNVMVRSRYKTTRFTVTVLPG